MVKILLLVLKENLCFFGFICSVCLLSWEVSSVLFILMVMSVCGVLFLLVMNGMIEGMLVLICV